jgi:DNA-binding MarR family transcriptional regulator
MDRVDLIVEQWARQRPDLDLTAMGMVARILRLSRVLEREINLLFERFGLNRGEFDVLAALRRSGRPFRLTPSRLADSLLISTGAMTNRIDRLEQSGLVRRLGDDSDRRVVVVELTARGQRLIDRTIDEHVDNERRLAGRLNTPDQRELNDLLRRWLMGLEGNASTDVAEAG